MAQSIMREDIECDNLDVTEFVGQNLTGPRELITRGVLCSNPQVTMTEAYTEGILKTYYAFE